jgi:hypothetical protein
VSMMNIMTSSMNLTILVSINFFKKETDVFSRKKSILRTNAGVFVEFVAAILIICIVINGSVTFVWGGVNPIRSYFSAELRGSSEVPAVNTTGSFVSYGYSYEISLKNMLSEHINGIVEANVQNGTKPVAALPFTAMYMTGPPTYGMGELADKVNGLYVQGDIGSYSYPLADLLALVKHHEAYINIDAQQILPNHHTHNVAIRGLLSFHCWNLVAQAPC